MYYLVLDIPFYTLYNCILILSIGVLNYTIIKLNLIIIHYLLFSSYIFPNDIASFFDSNLTILKILSSYSLLDTRYRFQVSDFWQAKFKISVLLVTLIFMVSVFCYRWRSLLSLLCNVRFKFHLKRGLLEYKYIGSDCVSKLKESTQYI